MNCNTLSAMYFTLLSNVYLMTYAEIYTSTAEIEHLLDTRKKLIEDLSSYIDKEEERLSAIKRYLYLYKREHRKAMRDISNYVGNPISVFIMIKSLTVDLKDIKSKITIGRDIIDNVTIKHMYSSYPTSEDLKGAAKGLSRLKKIYNLHVQDLAEGNLNDATVSAPLSASDCYELGRVLYKVEDYEIGRAFMEEAYHKYNREQIFYPFSSIDILEHIGFGSYLLGDLRYGKKWIEKILQIDPNNERAIFSNTFFQNEIQKIHGLKKETNNKNGKQNYNQVKQNVTNNYENFEELCRGYIDVPLQVSRRLTCSYLTESHPFLKIAPIKMEMKYLNPDLILFHDVTSDKEIETIKRLATQRLHRAKIIDENSGKTYVQDGLSVSKTAPVYDKESDILLRISQRVTHMTGLSLEKTKLMEVINYGIGGYCNPHHDFLNVTPETYTKLAGRRMASIMFYLSDVAQGGATVFTKLGVRIYPVKGTALFWYNLHPSGEGNHAMLHAACPILQGSKWLLVRFLHQTGQELRKPCNLENQEEGIKGFIHPPMLKDTRYLDLFKIEYEMASKSVSNYLENPLNAFILIKRLTTDLSYVKNIIKNETEHIKNVTKKHENLQYPTSEDLIGTVMGLMTLKEVYNLDIKEMARGKLNGYAYSTSMTASDCYELGRILFNELDPEAAIAWMEEALRKYYEEKFPYLFDDVDIMEFISYGNYMLGDPKTALHWTNKILNIDPNHARSRNSLLRYQKEIAKQETKLKSYIELEEETFEQETEKDFDIKMKDVMNDPNSPETYHSLCRGDISVPVEISSRLTCRYLTEKQPFLKIAPFKIEIIYENPAIILFHDVLSDAEINKMKELAKPRLRRAMIYDQKTGESMHSNDRISKSATILDTYSDIFAIVSRRVTHMTGLNMEKTEDIQIANYGIGGYYLPHHDFVQLSDVSQGGATIFPYLGVSVSPVKGTAIFWYNLYSSGEANHAMLHAGCPVLRGSKWVATKWILQDGQEFIKPCNLEYQPEGINDNIPRPVPSSIRKEKIFENYKKHHLRETKKLPQYQQDIEVYDE